MSPLSVPGNPDATVWSVLKRIGPSTLATLSEWTGIPQARLRTHLRSHRDAYCCITKEEAGIKLRLWYTKGPIQ